jgi:hypothetical protein
MKSVGAILFVFTIVGMQSCKKEYCIKRDSDHIGRLASVKNYHIDGTFYTLDYKYNSQGKMENEKQISSNNFVLFETVFYYQNGHLKTEQLGTSPKIAEFRYTYNGQLLSENEYVEYISGSAKRHFKRTFLYEKSKITKIIENNLENDSLSNYSIFSYTGDNISNIKTYDIHTNELKSETQLEYDDKKNPFYAVKENTGNALYTSKNNITSETILVKNGMPVNDVTIYEYEYNLYDQPVKKSHLLKTGGKLLEQSYIYH